MRKMHFYLWDEGEVMKVRSKFLFIMVSMVFLLFALHQAADATERTVKLKIPDCG